MGGIEYESFRFNCPDFADVFVGCQATESFETASVIVGIDEGELFTLAESGVTSIDLASTSGSITIEGNYATDFSTYTNADGQQQSIADVWFKFSQVNVLHEKFEIADESILALPSLNANGRVVNLHRSMDLDPHLKAMVETFSANTIADLAKVSAQSEEIILQ